MRYIKGLTKDTLKLLERIYKQSKYYQVRQRAHCILLSYQRYKISELMVIFRVSRNTIYNWLLPSHPKITELNRRYDEWYSQSVLVFEVDEIKNNRSISVRFVQWLRSRANDAKISVLVDE